MTSPIAFQIDDRDFDDAALWAVIDSAEANLQFSRSRRTQTLAVRYPNLSSPPTPITRPSPPLKLQQNSKKHRNSHNSIYSPPNKVARICEFETTEETSPPALPRIPGALSKSNGFDTESYLSPEIGKSCLTEFKNESEQREVTPHCLNGMFPSVSLFKEFQNAAMAVLEKSDYTVISGNNFIKKSGWRKISLYFNVSYEIKDKTIEFDDNRNVLRAEFIVRAHMKGGRFSDGWGSCDKREKRFMKPNHDIPSTAETRAKNKACQDLLGIGEYRRSAN